MDQLEQGHNIGLSSIPTPVHCRSNPPMDEISNCKIAQTILKWHDRKYLMGPYSSSDPIVKTCRVNPIFCVPKPDDTVRPVVNYSKEINGTSLNDLLDPDWCSVEYIKLKEIVYTVSQVGPGAMIWTKDLEDGYFNIKVHPDQAKCMAFMFAGLLFIPMILMFGLSSAPLIFTIFMWYVVMAIRLVDHDIMWKLLPIAQFEKQYFQTDADFYPDRSGKYIYFPLVMYYLDDIFGVQTPDKVHRQYALAGQILKYLGLSTKASKDRPPNTVQKILGLIFDTIKQEIRIPRDKVRKYVKYAYSLMARKRVTKTELFSLTGKARHASVQCHALSSFVEINNAPYFQVRWDDIDDTTDRDIQWQELVAICVLFETNLELFRGKCVHILCDNESVVWMLIKWRADLNRPDLQHLLRRIARFCIFNDILPYWDHIDGVKNITADRLSRFHHSPFEQAKVSPGKLSNSARSCLQKCADLCST